MPIKITSIKREEELFRNPYTAITQLRWVDEDTGEEGQHSLMEVYLWIKHEGLAYVEADNGRKATVIAVEENGARYLKTICGEGKLDLLLSLPEFF